MQSPANPLPFAPLDPWLTAALVVAVVGLAVLALWKLRRQRRPPYRKAPSLLTPAELVFFRTLERVVGPAYYLFPKVRLGDLIVVPEGTENARGWFARVGQKHVDFVLCDRQTLAAVLAIELDDSSHLTARRQERDRFVDGALAAAGLPIVRVVARREYDPFEVAAAVAEKLRGFQRRRGGWGAKLLGQATPTPALPRTAGGGGGARSAHV